MKKQKSLLSLLLVSLLAGCNFTQHSTNNSSSSGEQKVSSTVSSAISESSSSEQKESSTVSSTISESSSSEQKESSTVHSTISDSSSSESSSSIEEVKADVLITPNLLVGSEFDVVLESGNSIKFKNENAEINNNKIVLPAEGKIYNLYTADNTNAITNLKNIVVYGEGSSVTVYYGFSDDYLYGEGLTEEKAYSKILEYGEEYDFEGKLPCYVMIQNDTESDAVLERIELNINKEATSSILVDPTPLAGFESSGNNISYAGKYGAVVSEKEGNGWSSLKATQASDNWYLKADLSDLVENLHTAGTWESIGLGMIDKDDKHMQFTFWKPASDADKAGRVANFGLIDQEGNIIKQCIPSSVYNCSDLSLAIHRESNLYHFYINDMMALTYDFSNAANYTSTENDYPALVTRGVGVSYSNVELYYGDDIETQLPKTFNYDYAYNVANSTPDLVDVSNYSTDGTISFKASNQDTASYRALATYNYVGDTFAIKAKFSNFSRTEGLVALGIKAGNAESVKINGNWGKANLFGLYFDGSTTVKVGARTDSYNGSRTYGVEWADALNGDFELEIRWIKGNYYCNFIGYNEDETKVESGWIYWNLVTNGYYGIGVNGDRMSPVIASFANAGEGVVSNIEVSTGSAVVAPENIVKTF